MGRFELQLITISFLNLVYDYSHNLNTYSCTDQKKLELNKKSDEIKLLRNKSTTQEMKNTPSESKIFIGGRR
jgi:hypothetical protein